MPLTISEECRVLKPGRSGSKKSLMEPALQQLLLAVILNCVAQLIVLLILH